MRSRLVTILLLFAFGSSPAQGEAALPASRDDHTQDAIIGLLRENRQEYGDDAAILQGLLLVNATRSGPLLASEVAIEGFETRGDQRFVTFRVESGAILDDDHYDRDRRVSEMWHRIVERSLLRYPSFAVPVDGIAIEVRYHHWHWRSRRAFLDSIDDSGPVEKVKFYLLSSNLTPFLDRKFGSAELIRRSEILVDGEPATPHIEDRMGPTAPNDTPELGPLY